MKLLDVDVLHAGIDEILQRLSTQAEQIKRVESAVKGVVNLSDSFTGMGGQAILSYYQNDHLTFLASYQTFLRNYTNTLKQMKVAIQTLEPLANGFIRQSYLESELERGLLLLLTQQAKRTGTYYEKICKYIHAKNMSY
ncbi:MULTISPECIES: T7SS effector LXG polymorphic toxin [Bacillus]|uniref:T7SS effector LXG polymorphic toxin n=1 Tax=Bacillus TaxID=1386 RepID=UPI0003069B72|nr:MULTISPECIES: T7SS effector LXG polymorphic toxin [Bacillus]